MIPIWKFKDLDHRRSIYPEETSKVVAAAWFTELFQFLASYCILHQDNLKNKMIDKIELKAFLSVYILLQGSWSYKLGLAGGDTM